MSYQSLLNTTCEVYRKSATRDARGIIVRAETLLGSYKTRCVYSRGKEDIINGKPTPVIESRFYLQNNIDIKNEDIIVWNNNRFEVNWVNPMSFQGGLVAGLQVDTQLIDK